MERQTVHIGGYVCPMHPNVVSDSPGRCAQCGMLLVEKGGASSAPANAHHDDRGLGSVTWRSYIPLAVIVTLIVIAALAASVSLSGGVSLNTRGLLLGIMTGFFLVFGGFKLMDLSGFADGYATYDLLAQRWRGYGFLYPFIEIAFGLAMLAGFHPDGLLWAEFGVMAFSGIGVAIKVAKRERFMCACLGTFLKVPLTYVTLVEDFGMASLALALVIL